VTALQTACALWNGPEARQHVASKLSARERWTVIHGERGRGPQDGQQTCPWPWLRDAPLWVRRLQASLHGNPDSAHREVSRPAKAVEQLSILRNGVAAFLELNLFTTFPNKFCTPSRGGHHWLGDWIWAPEVENAESTHSMILTGAARGWGESPRTWLSGSKRQTEGWRKNVASKVVTWAPRIRRRDARCRCSGTIGGDNAETERH
jgi:hypothetical protein